MYAHVPEERNRHIAVLLSKVGGFDGSPCLRSAEAYNPQTNTWHEVSPMLLPKRAFGIAMLDELLFVVGGYNGYSDSYNVQCYDGTTDEWHVACDMNFAHSDIICCVVFGLSNMADYVVPRDFLPCLNLEDESSDSAESLDSV
ncbi:uncharacterized protein LOC117254663 [Epinephelus lanceolatus]